MKKKEETIKLAARMMADARWKNTTAKERSEHSRRVAQTPRTAKRCFCGASSMLRAAERYFDCCRRAGVVVLNLKARETNDECKTNGG